MRATAPLPLLLAVLLVPGGAASTVDVTFATDFTSADAAAAGELTSGESAQLRYLMDGNGDGQVSEAEAQRAATDYRSTIEAYVGRVLRNLTLDGEPPAGAPMRDLAFHGAPGPTLGGGPIAFRFNLTFLFAPEDQDRHAWRVVGAPSPGGRMQVSVTPPAGWRVDSTAPEGLVQVGPGNTRATFGMPTDGTPVEVTMAAEAADKPASAFGLVHALAALAAALAVAAASPRRR